MPNLSQVLLAFDRDRGGNDLIRLVSQLLPAELCTPCQPPEGQGKYWNEHLNGYWSDRTWLPSS